MCLIFFPDRPKEALESLEPEPGHASIGASPTPTLQVAGAEGKGADKVEPVEQGFSSQTEGLEKRQVQEDIAENGSSKPPVEEATTVEVETKIDEAPESLQENEHEDQNTDGNGLCEKGEQPSQPSEKEIEQEKITEQEDETSGNFPLHPIDGSAKPGHGDDDREHEPQAEAA